MKRSAETLKIYYEIYISAGIPKFTRKYKVTVIYEKVKIYCSSIIFDYIPIIIAIRFIYSP